VQDTKSHSRYKIYLLLSHLISLLSDRYFLSIHQDCRHPTIPHFYTLDFKPTCFANHFHICLLPYRLPSWPEVRAHLFVWFTVFMPSTLSAKVLCFRSVRRVHSFVRPNRSCYRDISWTAWAISMKLTLCIHLPLLVTWLDYGGQRSRSQQAL